MIGSLKIRPVTQKDYDLNSIAMKLCDKVAERSGFVVYRKTL
jgi:hypothetical protein